MSRSYTSGHGNRPRVNAEYVKRKLEFRGQYGAADVLQRSSDMARKGVPYGKNAVDMFVRAFQRHPISVHAASEFGYSVILRDLVKRASSSDHNIGYEALLYNFMPANRSYEIMKKTPVIDVLAELQIAGRGFHILDIVDRTKLFPQQVIESLNILRLNEGFFYRGHHISSESIANMFAEFSTKKDLYGNRPLRTVVFSDDMMEWGMENRLGMKVVTITALNLSRVKLKHDVMEVFPPNPNYDLDRRETATLDEKKFIVSDRAMIEATKDGRRELKPIEVVEEVCGLREEMVQNLLRKLNPDLQEAREYSKQPVVLERYRVIIKEAEEARKTRMENNKRYRRRMLAASE
jgi:hypothetical protein